MYKYCLSCSTDLGHNEAVESFPLGRRLAFDMWKGRLWVVCPGCRRWNLAPIEERWEPVEALEKLFRETTTRAQAENIALARLADGTTLVRVGHALEGEFAAWRYGDELRRRRWKGILSMGGLIAGGLVLGQAGMSAGAAVGLPGAGLLLNFGAQFGIQLRLQRRVVHRLPAHESPTGQAHLIRRMHLIGAVLSHDEQGPALLLPAALQQRSFTEIRRAFGFGGPLGISEIARHPILALHGPAVQRVSGRALITSNTTGASRRQVQDALALIERAGGPDAFLQTTATRDLALPARGPGQWKNQRTFRPRLWDRSGDLERLPEALQHHLGARGPQALGRTESIALEMALHEERERRALEGELAALLDEWREAEMLARIADALPEEPALETEPA